MQSTLCRYYWYTASLLDLKASRGLSLNHRDGSLRRHGNTTEFLLIAPLTAGTTRFPNKLNSKWQTTRRTPLDSSCETRTPSMIPMMIPTPVGIPRMALVTL